MKQASQQNVRWQEILGRGLMFLAAIGALYAFVSSLAGVKSAPAETLWVELWRSMGFLVFTGMFLLLGLRPRKSAGLWELAFFHKASMAVISLLIPNAMEATSAGLVDGILAMMLVVAYLLTRGWKSWQSASN